MSSRVVELEALTNVLKSQLDQACTSEQHAVREVQRELDRAEIEIERLRERLQDMESKEETLGMCILITRGCKAMAFFKILRCCAA